MCSAAEDGGAGSGIRRAGGDDHCHRDGIIHPLKDCGWAKDGTFPFAAVCFALGEIARTEGLLAQAFEEIENPHAIPILQCVEIIERGLADENFVAQRHLVRSQQTAARFPKWNPVLPGFRRLSDSPPFSALLHPQDGEESGKFALLIGVELCRFALKFIE